MKKKKTTNKTTNYKFKSLTQEIPAQSLNYLWGGTTWFMDHKQNLYAKLYMFKLK